MEQKENNENSLIPLSINGMRKILSQMKKSICKITVKETECTGFFCKYYYSSKFLPVLITANSVLNKANILKNKALSIKLYGELNCRDIKIDKFRKIFEYKELDITIVEIIPNKDNINSDSFLELEENIKNPGLNSYFSKLSIYILNYKGDNIEVMYGILSEIKDNKIYHNCFTENISPFSPILNLNNFKVIGIQSRPSSDLKPFTGTFLNFSDKKYDDILNKNTTKIIPMKVSKNKEKKIIISESNKNLTSHYHSKSPESTLLSINNKLKSSKIINNNLFLLNNEMTIKYLIKEDKKIQIFGGEFVKKNKGKCKIIINNTEKELYQYLDTKNLKKIKIIEIKLIEIKTITDMSKIFSNCIYLYSLPDISKWDTSLVTNMSYMFSCCFSLSNYDGISKWDISNVTNLSHMFWGCSTSKSIPDISGWNTSNVIDMSYMFSRCLLLESLPDISNWNTENVIHMEYMFWKCTKLTTLPNISKWNIKNETDIKGIFNGCKNLLEIPDKFKK